jgi:D-alanyl-D-alanine carboxypeptidase/D-alanyl-D-alanine-endopeptidase (penicillin-binding protein 4)
MRAFTLLTLSFLLAPLGARAGWDAVLDQGSGARVRFGVALEGKDPFRRNEAESFAPASTAKLFTAGAILAALGPDYRYPTLVRWSEPEPGTASRLTLVGSGDPSWGVPELKEGPRSRLDLVAAALQAAGVRIVEGAPAAVPADPRWSAVTIPEGWKDSDTESCGGALAQAFNIGLNCATLTVRSPTQYAWANPGLTWPVRLNLRAGQATNLGARFTDGRFVVEGTWKSGTSPRRLTLPVYDTRAWAAALFRSALEARGIRVVPAPPRAAGVPRELTFYSPPLAELLKPFLKNSVNFLGDAFLKTLGARSASRDASLLAPGLTALNAFLAGFGDARDFTLHDGSGLSRTSRVTPAFLLRYLDRISGEKFFPALYAALPVAGVDGTLSHRMKGTAAAGRLRGKTGTLDGVYNLAGYVPDAGGFTPFVVLTRTTSSLSGAARAAEDRLGARLAALHARPGAEAEPVVPYPYYPEHAGFDAQ